MFTLRQPGSRLYLSRASDTEQPSILRHGDNKAANAARWSWPFQKGTKYSCNPILGDINSGCETRDVNVARRGLLLQRRVGREDVNNSVPLPNSEGGGLTGKTVVPGNHVSVWGSLGGSEFRGPRRLPMTVPLLCFSFSHISCH